MYVKKNQFIVLFLNLCIPIYGTTIMLNPAGDARNAGRVIDNTFERGLTLQLCNELKQELSQQLPDIYIALTRFPGETVEPLQNAQFANRLNIDLFVAIQLYSIQEPKPLITIYQYIYHPTNLWHKPCNELEFIDIDNAHLNTAQQTHKLGKIFHTFLQKNEYHHQLAVNNFLSIPFKPLFGIQAPALGIEIGISYKEQWRLLIPIISEGIRQLLTHLS